MLANFHTHTQFCDGKSTPEEVVLSAIEKGFSALGFSGHGYTDFDLETCINDTPAYIKEISRLKEKYKRDIEIYLGIEEDALSLVDRSKYDYIIGSYHYLYINNQYFPIDLSHDHFKKCLALFDFDILRFAEAYFRPFCEYIISRKPDIIGHFDLITKYEEQGEALLLNNAEYNKIAEKYITKAAKSGCIFEVNTGAIARGLRTTPYPSTNLLYTLKKLDAPIILSSDSHHADTLDFKFDEIKRLLRDIGFTKLFTFHNGKFISYDI